MFTPKSSWLPLEKTSSLHEGWINLTMPLCSLLTISCFCAVMWQVNSQSAYLHAMSSLLDQLKRLDWTPGDGFYLAYGLSIPLLDETFFASLAFPLLYRFLILTRALNGQVTSPTWICCSILIERTFDCLLCVIYNRPYKWGALLTVLHAGFRKHENAWPLFQ